MLPTCRKRLHEYSRLFRAFGVLVQENIAHYSASAASSVAGNANEVLRAARRDFEGMVIARGAAKCEVLRQAMSGLERKGLVRWDVDGPGWAGMTRIGSGGR
jgi:hypothetical protein